MTASDKVPEVVKGGHEGGLDVVGHRGWGAVGGIQMCRCNVQDLGVGDKWREQSRGLEPRTLHILLPSPGSSQPSRCCYIQRHVGAWHYGRGPSAPHRGFPTNFPCALAEDTWAL